MECEKDPLPVPAHNGFVSQAQKKWRVVQKTKAYPLRAHETRDECSVVPL
jgi:hypothetical protein